MRNYFHLLVARQAPGVNLFNWILAVLKHYQPQPAVNINELDGYRGLISIFREPFALILEAANMHRLRKLYSIKMKKKIQSLIT